MMRFSQACLVMLLGYSAHGCERDCPIGSETCACTQGGSCDGDLECRSGLCVEGAGRVPSREAAGDAPQGLSSAERRRISAEARANIAKIRDGIAASSAQAGISRAEIAAIGDGAALHLSRRAGCPSALVGAKGEAGFTPPLDVNCFAGPQHRCIPSENPSTAPGHYDIAVWDTKFWGSVAMVMEVDHYFHYNVKHTKTDEGCRFAVTAKADLDGDGEFSTFSTTCKVDGRLSCSEMTIENELE